MQKALTKHILIDIAQRPHNCRYNKRHRILSGDKRLKVVEGRSHQHYCVECAKKFLSSDIEKLKSILSELE